jgi:beta-glucanase (GH16 family)
MNQIEWSKHKWITQERWGQIHKDKSWCWYDSSCVKLDNWGYLHLETHKNSKTFDLDGKIVTSNYGVGLISSVEDFGYGFFEIEAKLPTGKKLWPAFWMWSGPWPPEIDILEGYTDNRQGYFKPQFTTSGVSIWNVPTNIWTHKVGGKVYNLGAKTAPSTTKNPASNFIKYSCLWTKDIIEIKHDGVVVRKITDSQTLKYFADKKMNVVINNHLQSDPPNKENYSDFVVKYFKYEKA